MLNRLFASLAILSLVVALFVCVLWWRANHGHTDTFHMGANSATQTVFTTLPGARVSVDVESHESAQVNSRTEIYPMRSVLGGAFLLPSLWAAILLRRKLMPRRPGSELPALGRH